MFKPIFKITPNLLTYISSIESAKAIINHSPLVPSWEARFKDEAMTRTIHFGTKIEGNDLTRDQASQVVKLSGVVDSKEVMRKTGIIARERDVQEVINYRNVMLWIDQQNVNYTSQLLSVNTLKTMHHLTLANILDESKIGKIRTQQVVVRGADDGQIVFRPPIAIEVPFLIEEFFKWLNSEESVGIHPILKAAIIHYRLVYIHPFIEGNGRTARAMATLYLYATDYNFKKFFSLEQYFDSDVNKYYQALLSVQQNQNFDLTYWLEYFCYGLAIEIGKVKEQVMKLSKDLKLKRELGAQVALSERQIILLELLQNQGEITSDDAQKILPQISVDTILRDIKDLISKGVIKKHGVTKGVRYTLRD